MNIKYIDLDKYYRKDSFNRFTKEYHSSFAMTSRIDVTDLVNYSKKKGTKFYIDFLYLIAKVVNSRDDYKMIYFYKENKLGVFDKVNVTHYVFHNETETCTPVHTEYTPDYQIFYSSITRDIALAKENKYQPDQSKDYSDYFDASFLPWYSYDAFSLELPDGYLYFLPIINWGKYRLENNRLMMPVSIRLNHASADGYLASKFYLLLEEEMKKFIQV